MTNPPIGEHLYSTPSFVKATIIQGHDGNHRISLHRMPQIHLEPTVALCIAREIQQFAIDAMRADGERADDQEGL